MDSRYILEKSSVGTRVGVGGADSCRAGRSVHHDTRVPTVEKNGPMPAYTHGPVLYKFVVDVGSAAEVASERSSPKGTDCLRTGRGDQKDTGSTGILKRASPTHCPGVNGQSHGGFMHFDISNQGNMQSWPTASGQDKCRTYHRRLKDNPFPLPTSLSLETGTVWLLICTHRKLSYIFILFYLCFLLFCYMILSERDNSSEQYSHLMEFKLWLGIKI
ncbi:hypothetical protein INR49_013334 [Caranx melampygus]|nr:hypothetical protein INR49_013334 [Caranx melampygus]